MPARKLKLSRPDRLAHRLVKLANALNSMAELNAEFNVALQDAARAAIQLLEEIEEETRAPRS